MKKRISKDNLLIFVLTSTRCLMNMARTLLLAHYIIQILGFYNLNKEKYFLHMTRHHGLP